MIIETFRTTLAPQEVMDRFEELGIDAECEFNTGCNDFVRVIIKNEDEMIVLLRYGSEYNSISEIVHK